MNVSGANNSLSDVDNSPSGADDILSRCAGAKLTTEESARILSEILPIFFHERMQPLDPRHVSEQACARLLAEHAELQTLLEEAVEAQSCRVFLVFADTRRPHFLTGVVLIFDWRCPLPSPLPSRFTFLQGRPAPLLRLRVFRALPRRCCGSFG